MKVTIERGIDANGNDFCTWSIDDYKTQYNFFSDDDYSKLVGRKIITRGFGSDKTEVYFGQQVRIFNFTKNIGMNLGKEEIMSELVKRRDQINEWIKSVVIKETIEFEI